MADPDRILKVLRDAATHHRACKDRKGMVIHVQDAKEIMVAGDLHGHLENFRTLVKIAALERHPFRRLILQEFVHGSERYQNGTDASHRLLDVAAALVCQFPNQVHLLMANHELAQMTGRAIAKNGEHLNELFEAGVETAYGARAPDVLAAYYELIETLPLAVRTTNRVFISHSIPPSRRIDAFDIGIFDLTSLPESEFELGSSTYDLLWGRDVTEPASRRFAEAIDADLLVTGHIVQKGGYGIPNRRHLIVDCTGSPACYILFPTRRPLTHKELVQRVHTLPTTTPGHSA